MREHLEHDVDALAARRFHDRIEVVRILVVDHDVRAVIADRVHAAIAAGGADDRHAVGARELHGRDADAAARAVDSTVSPGLAFARMNSAQYAVRVRHADRGALRERDVGGQRVQLRRLTERLLGVGPGARQAGVVVGDVDAIAGLERFHVGADRFDFARAVGCPACRAAAV